MDFDTKDRSYWAVFKNYNSFPVTVLCLVTCKGRSGHWLDEKTVNVVLGVNGTKRIELGGDVCYGGSVNGMIVRKLAQ